MLNLHSPSTSKSITRVAVLVVLLVVTFMAGSCSLGSYTVAVESIAFGTVLLEPSLPLFVAESQGFFVQNRLNVTFKIYDVGLNAATALVNGEVDMASPVAEYVMVGKIFDNKKIQAIASIDEVDYALVIGRKDRGIEDVSDLKGKKIGVVRGTILEFQLGRFLELNGVNPAEVTLVHGTLPESTSAIVSGELDAVMSIPPFTTSIQKQLDANAALWSAQNIQPFYSLVLADQQWVQQHPKIVERFLMSMRQAEEFIIEHPDRAEEILQKKLNFSDEEMARVWSQNQYSLLLDQSLILAMEDEARWMIENNLTSQETIPNFLDYLYLDGLRTVKPEAVNIIH
jgi:ABC-type nitrate/sulfonate/bicarbonate transport system substrate-binding protein